MTRIDDSEQARDMQDPLKPTVQAFQDGASRFWSAQDQILDSMQKFAEDWLRRRHEGTHAAAQAAQRMCKAENPAALFKEQQVWMSGAIQRLMADGIACQKEWVRITGLAVQSLNDPRNEADETRSAQQAPERRKADSGNPGSGIV